jgi:hypothetical protein
MTFTSIPSQALCRNLAAIWAPLAVMGAATTAYGQCVQGHFFPVNRDEGLFGAGVSISGDTAAVGAPDENAGDAFFAGAVYVFVRNGGVWTQQAHLVASDASTHLFFGSSVAISGDTLAVGANGTGGSNAVYVFERSGGVWTQQARLVPSGNGGEFGTSVALSGDTVLAGAYESRVAHVFVRSGGVWTEQAQLLPSDSASYFGWSVALSSETALVGAPEAGRAYVFVRNGATWTQEARLTPDGLNYDWFGGSVSISGDTAVVGAYLDDTAAGNNAGSAYVFVRSGGVWTQQAHLFASDAAAGDLFGGSSGISDNTIAVGAAADSWGSFAHAGSVYVFTRSADVWAERAHVFAPDGGTSDNFGIVVAIDGQTVGMTALPGPAFRAGAVYVFDLGCCSGDLDGTGAVDLSDLAIVLAHFGMASGGRLTDGDFDADGDVDLGDLANMLSLIGAACP